MDEQEILKVLKKYSEKDFSTLIPRTMLKLSESETLTVEFVFWFCHIVEQDLNEVLAGSSKMVSEILGPTSKELNDFIRKEYGIKFEKVDPSHDDYNDKDVTFGDRINFVEKLRGKTPSTSFLWKVKNIRDDLSHGRIKELSYEGQKIVNITTKEKMISDYISLSLNIDNEKEGGIAAQLTDDDKKRVNELWEKHNSKGSI
jgi:hypothetical protein